MMGIIFCAFYLLLFSIIILKSPLFHLPGLKNSYALTAFILKLGFGTLLWYIYAYHYNNRYTSDIFKYYDDGKMIYQCAHTNFSDFVKMFTGIGDSNPHIQAYYHQMNSWLNDHDSNLYNNSHFIIRLNTFFMFLSGGNYGVHVIFMCFISLVGLSYLYKAFYPYLTDKPKELFAALFLFPSVLLWGSGILKEGLVFLGLGLTLYFYFKALNKQGSLLKNSLMVLLGFILLFEAKAYVLLCIIPALKSEFLIKKVRACANHPWLTYIGFTTLYLLVGLNLNVFLPKLNPLQMMADKQRDLNRMVRGGIYLEVQGKDSGMYARIEVQDSSAIIPANGYADSLLHHGGIPYLTSSAFCYKEQVTGVIAPFRLKKDMHYELIRMLQGDTLHPYADDFTLYRIDIYTQPANSKVDIAPIQPTILSLVKHVPAALAIALIRPLPGEKVSSGMVKIYMAENFAVLLLIALALLCYKRKSEHQNIIALCLTYSLLMLVLIGLATPLYGGIERYKSVVIPFMLILLLLIYDKDKLKRILKLKK